MTSYEVVWFLNHKYGEQAYVIETDKQILIFTSKSKWIIFKDDRKRFKAYTLFHSNYEKGEGYHIQRYGNCIDFLTWCAVTHDMEEYYEDKDFQKFTLSWELYLLGRECEERAALFQWFCD